MISPISGSLASTQVAASQQPAPSASTAPSNSLPQDTVTLSSQGRAAAGDVDHDGDSH